MSHIKNFFTGRVRFEVQNLPINCLNRLRQYHLRDVCKTDTQIAFTVSLVYANNVKKLVNNFDWQAYENYNFFRSVNFLLNHFIFTIAVLIAFVGYLICDMGVYNIKIACNDESMTPEIYQYLQTLGITDFAWKKQVYELDLANEIVTTFPNVAHANVRIAGNTLLVNLITATNAVVKNKTNIYARYDAVIKQVTTYTGTALVTVGDVVKKGDLLVTDAYPDSVIIIGEVGFANQDLITRLDISII